VRLLLDWIPDYLQQIRPWARILASHPISGLYRHVGIVLAFWRYSTVSIKFSTKGLQVQFCSGKR
jgi:hypothetical protein